MIETADHGLQTVVLAGRRARVADVGGKAAMLDRLLQLGAPVPPCGVVTTAAYRAFVEHAGLSVHLDRLRTESRLSPGQAEVAQREVDRRFLEAPMPDGLADAIVVLANEVGTGAAVAVRSSATAEDLTTASFAGQYHTSLGVEPDDAVHAVRLCWASLWHPEPRAYRRFRGIDDSEVAMAALLMPMLDPTWAGVLFTVDPACPSAIRIEMVEGLAESLVSGSRTPDVVTIDRNAVDSFDGRPEGLGRLADLALDLERRIGTPLDIEWALERGELSLLQARPITSERAAPGESDDDGFDVADADTRYTTAGIGEMLPGVLPPRLWDLNSWLVEEGLRGLFRSLGADPGGLDEAHALVGRVRGRAALDLDLMEHVVETVPGGSVAELEHQYFGDALDPTGAPASAPVDGSRLRQGVRTLRARARAYRESEVVIQAIDRVLADEPHLSELEDRALLTLRGRVLHLACRTMEAEISVAAAASASYRGLEILLREHLPADEATQALQRLTMGDRSTHRGRRALDLDALIARLADEEELAPAGAIESWPDAREVLESTPAGRSYSDKMFDALRRAGSTSVFGGATWDDTPEFVWPMLRAGVAPVNWPPGSGADRREAALSEVECRLASAPRWRFTRWVTGQVVDVRKRFLRREAKDAATFLERREHTKAALLMLGGVVWRIDGELGRRLSATGRLDDAADVDLLTGREVAAALEGRPPPPDLIERRRRRLDAARLEPPLPRVFRGRPGPAPAPEMVGDRVRGWAGSPGWYEGVARFVESPRKSELRRGDVLVARTTDASWLPLFHTAGAIVVEQGGPLSHAAILARELGMPAVINVPGIVERVRDRPGSLLMVDGNTGDVAIHPPESDPVVHLDDPDRKATGPAEGTAPPSRPAVIGGGDPNRLGVFITGLIGAGAMMSIAIGLTQAIGSARARQRIGKRARPRAESLAVGTLHGYEPAVVGRAGLRPRGFYAWLATIALLIGALVLWVGDDYVEDPASASALWLLALGLVSAVTLLSVAVIALIAAVRWPVISPTARRLSLPRVHENRNPVLLIGRVHSSVAAALLLVVLVLAWFIAEAEGELLAVDKWIFDRVGAGTGDNWWYPAVLDDLLRVDVTIPVLGGTTTLIVPLAIVLTVATYRCRPLMFTYPLVIAAAGLLHVVLQHFFTRDRPELGPKPGFDDSFPGGHANELTVLLGLLPLVVYVLIRSNWLRIALEALCAFVLIIALADSVRIGDHWPSDNLSGFLIGAAMVLIARGVARSPTLHTRCRGCPAQEHAAREAERSS